jgi:hypothetical protein
MTLQQRNQAMNNEIKFNIVAVVLLTIAGGCYTSQRERDHATSLAKDIDAYRNEQSQRLDQINSQYRFDYARLVEDVTKLRLSQLQQFFDLDSMAAAGEVLTDWEHETLPRKIRDRFADSLERRRERLLEVDKQIDDARSAYADAYQAVQLNLGQLKSAQAGVEALAVPEDRRKTAAEFVLTVGQIVNDLHEQALKEEKAAAKK